ncbi:DNA-binding response OmpR family regulator [Sinomonas atrocyanea]|uniref:response regulator transcription factor n=1 Tax=Sinomonas atrocyanea TaxID=37927 RepID=UPI002780476A|nr:response regulator transcription factor [Sinomonas atrocyanea]MDP9882585.1 DNA-binding response OmpR family regulator [Sinomonas atrocyanea]
MEDRSGSTGGERGLVLVVEDEHAIADLERLYLARAGYGVHVECDGGAALARVRQLRPVAIVLDVGLPGLDGIDVCRRLREAGDWTPVIFVTARDDEVDRVLGLELGADDYLTKPFSPRELVARVKGLLRRAAGPQPPRVLAVGAVLLDLDRRTAQADGQPVPLTAMEFDLLAYLMSEPGRVFSRGQLLSAVWGQADYGGGRTVDVHVAQLRAKLGAASPLRTARGVGYSASDEPDRGRP